jgi:hypothetical protein
MSLPEFKTCSCGRSWTSREEFLADPEIALVGYQPNFQHLELGLILFNHGSCQSTLGVEAGRFRDLHEGPTFKARRDGEADCPGQCFQRNNLEDCPLECECSWVRNLLPRLRRRRGPSG